MRYFYQVIVLFVFCFPLKELFQLLVSWFCLSQSSITLPCALCRPETTSDHFPRWRRKTWTKFLRGPIHLVSSNQIKSERNINLSNIRQLEKLDIREVCNKNMFSCEYRTLGLWPPLSEHHNDNIIWSSLEILTLQRSTCWRRCLSWTRTRGSRRSRQTSISILLTFLITTSCTCHVFLNRNLLIL